MKEILQKIQFDWKDFFSKMFLGVAVQKIIFDEKMMAVDTVCVGVNSVFEKITGLKKEEFLGKSMKKLFPSLENNWYENFGKVIKTGKPMVFEQKVDFLKKIFRVYMMKINDSEIAAVIDDISEYKNFEERLKESDSIYQAIVSSSKDAIVMMDNQGKISSWNLGAERLFGYTEKEVVGKDLHDLITVNKEHRENKTHLNVFFKTGKSPVLGKTIELPVKNRNKDQFVIELTVSATMLRDKWFGVGIMRDITERKKMEDELRERVRSSEILNKVMVDREIRMIELKKEIADLKKK